MMSVCAMFNISVHEPVDYHLHRRLSEWRNARWWTCSSHNHQLYGSANTDKDSASERKTNHFFVCRGVRRRAYDLGV